jgi:hypothetical protein
VAPGGQWQMHKVIKLNGGAWKKRAPRMNNFGMSIYWYKVKLEDAMDWK